MTRTSVFILIGVVLTAVILFEWRATNVHPEAIPSSAGIQSELMKVLRRTDGDTAAMREAVVALRAELKATAGGFVAGGDPHDLSSPKVTYDRSSEIVLPCWKHLQPSVVHFLAFQK